MSTPYLSLLTVLIIYIHCEQKLMVVNSRKKNLRLIFNSTSSFVVVQSHRPIQGEGFRSFNFLSGFRMGIICFHLRESHTPILIPEDTIVQTTGLILLSGQFVNVRISSMVGALSLDDSLAGGNPLVIFFQRIGISDISQNNLSAFTKLMWLK